MKINILSIFCISVFLLLSQISFSNDNEILFGGLAKVDITPPVGVPLAGYGLEGRRLPFPDWFNEYPYSYRLKPSVGIQDPIQSKSLLLKKGSKQILFISVDVVGVSYDVRDEIMSLLKPLGFNQDEILISATHTHSGPGGLSRNPLFEFIATDRFLEPIYNDFIRGIIESVIRAKNSLVPVKLYETSFQTSGIQINRRSEGRFVDQDADLLVVQKSDNNEFLGALLHYAIHGTALVPKDLLYSGDIPSALAQSTEDVFKKRGSINPVVLFINGAEGDVAPKAEGTQQLAQSATDFSTFVEHGLAGLKPVDSSWKIKVTNVKLGTPKLSLRSCVGLGKALSKYFAPLIKINMSRFMPKSTKIWSLRIGHLALLSWPGEATAYIGKVLKDTTLKNYGHKTWVMGLTNDHLGYFTNAQEYSYGGTEACMSFYGVNSGSKITNAHQKALIDLH